MVPSIFIYLMQREGKPLPEASLPFHRAMPSMTHMALVELEKAGILKFVISQVGLDYVIILVPVILSSTLCLLLCF